jgi:hypothetical protein
VKRAVLLSYGLAAVFGSFALAIVVVPTRLAMGAYLILFGWLIVAAFKMGMIFQTAPPASNASAADMLSLDAGPAASASSVSAKPEPLTARV